MGWQVSSVTAAQLRTRLREVTLRDERRLSRRLRRANSEQLRRLEAQVVEAEARLRTRRQAVPSVSYPPGLPIVDKRDELAAAIRDHQVVVVAGETGSGKTTQLPKICLELGRGVRGLIAHTQPRRLAARTIAERVAEELSVPLGGVVGYAVRFTDRVGEDTLIKLMTDGILLAEIQRDRTLAAYDTIIIDEAHERSLNIDFLLGYLRQLLPRRPDLKVIITSATIDPHRFADHFDGAPVVEVSGRTFPVEIRYRAPDDVEGEPLDQTEAIAVAVRELGDEPPGDVLVFLTGEREIRDTADALRALDLRDTEVLPLYARLPTGEQNRVWEAHSNRRIVLATNVAETSLTVPGIRYVIDAGLARISRYSKRTKVQRLPIEPISRASADQRAGRCGRVADGVCIRLYSEADYAARPRFTEPELLRTNLASVILRMSALGLGEVDAFGFLDPPDARAVRDGVALLHELGAFDAAGGITELGRTLAALPIEPRLARMIVEARDQGCVAEVLVLAAALSIPDPRERPAERRAAADQLHARFTDESSDYVTLLNLWRHIRERQRDLSRNQFRRMCREEMLNYLRVREWQDLRGQLRQIAAGLGIDDSGAPAEPAAIHAAVLSGLLSHVGLRAGETREFLGARNTRFVIAPGSVLARRPPQWVVAAELVETSRLFARTLARVEPETVERLAAHLVVRTYSEPGWNARRGSVTAAERVTLYGLPLVTGRRVAYGAIDPVASRELFIRHALVEGDWPNRHAFLRVNRELLSELAQLEERTRRRDIVVADDELFAFYDARIPPEIVSARHFDSWWKRARIDDPDRLTFTRADVAPGGTEEPGSSEHPDSWTSGDVRLPLTYRFAPGEIDDGVTVHVPLELLPRLTPGEFAWHVPALREDLVTALLRSLPKPLRRAFVPIPDTARAVLAALTEDQLRSESPPDLLQRELHRRTGVLVPRDAFDMTSLPPHLRLGFAVEDADRHVVARGNDLDALRSGLAAPTRAAVAEAVGRELERPGFTRWPADLDTVPLVVEGGTARGYPALVDQGVEVRLSILTTAAEQRAAMPIGTRRLLRFELPAPLRALSAGLSTRSKLVLAANPDGGLPELAEDCANAAVDALVAEAGGPAWTRAAFTRLREDVGTGFVERTLRIVEAAERVVAAANDARARLPASAPADRVEALADVRRQLDALLPIGFVTAAGADRLPDLVRYLRAVERRLDRLPRDLQLDRALMTRAQQVEQAYAELCSALPPLRVAAEDVRAIGWQLQELRVSLFAQQLGTPRPVSEQRIYRAIDAIEP
ncbi:MAG: ATP-dependent RNA helicase HrpA [Actinobacteria bacterium]|nr:ATP-dependent RNA helicase HrpA [Actinomycetota bacterium]